MISVSFLIYALFTIQTLSAEKLHYDEITLENQKIYVLPEGILLLNADKVWNDDGKSYRTVRQFVPRQEEDDDDKTTKKPDRGSGVVSILSGIFNGDLRKVIDGSLSFVPGLNHQLAQGAYQNIIQPLPTTTTTTTTTTPIPTTLKAAVESATAATTVDPETEEGEEGEEEEEEDSRSILARIARAVEAIQENELTDETRKASRNKLVNSLAPSELEEVETKERSRLASLLNRLISGNRNTGSSNTGSGVTAASVTNLLQSVRATRAPINTIPNINSGVSTILGGVFGGSLENILTGSFIFAPTNVQKVAGNVLDSVFGTNQGDTRFPSRRPLLPGSIIGSGSGSNSGSNTGSGSNSGVGSGSSSATATQVPIITGSNSVTQRQSAVTNRRPLIG